MQILIGIIGIAASFFAIKYRKQVIDFTGPWAWAETYLGGGGSYSAVALLAMLAFFLSIAYMTGTLDDVLRGTIGKLI